MNHIDADDCEYLQEMRIILLGRTGAGKSALGNSIFGSQQKQFPFDSAISSSFVSQIPKIAYREYGDRKLSVIDTNKSNDETMKKLNIAFQLANPGPHAFLFILSGRCTDEEINVLNILKKKFGEYFLDYCFIIVTHEDGIRDNDIQSSDDEIIQKYFQKAPQILQEFKIKCNNRCLFINNRASFEEREQKINRITQMIKHNEDQHPNTFFNQEMFDQAERYDREWNNEQFHRQQKEIEAEFAEIRLMQDIYEENFAILEEQQQMMNGFLAEKRTDDAIREGLKEKIAAKTMDAILCPKVSQKSTDKNHSNK